MEVRNDRAPATADLRPVFHMHAELCKALANEHRLAILYTLSQGERSVTQLAQEVGISLHNVSQHLRILKERLLVTSRKDGQTAYYAITSFKYIQGCSLIRQALVEQMRAQGQTLLDADLLDAVERMPLPKPEE